jgi:hypothetical protein
MKSSGNGHGPDEPDEKGLAAIKRAADRAWRQRQAQLKREARAEARRKAKDARIKARLEKAEKKRLKKAQEQLKKPYGDKGS